MRALQAALLALWMALGASASELAHKAGHIAAGAGIGLACAKMGHPKTGLVLAFGVAMAKEWADERSKPWGESYASRRRDVLITTAPALVIAIRWR